MRKNKKIDDHIRLEILNSYLHGTKGKHTIEKENGISMGSIRNWLRTFGLEDKPLPFQMKDKNVSTSNEDVSSEEDVTSLKLRIKQLESDLKGAEMARDVYDCMIDLAEEKYHIKVRKNFDVK
jgi:transposase-like protein